MPSQRREAATQFTQFADAVLIAVVFWFAHAFREWMAYAYPLTFPAIAPFRYYKWLYLVVLPLYPFLLDINGYYTRPIEHRRGQVLWILAKSAAICALGITATMYFLRLAGVSRGVILLFAIASIGALCARDLLVEWYLRRQTRRGVSSRAVVLVGSPERNAEFARLLQENPDWRLLVVAQLEPSERTLAELPQLLHSQPIACVIFNVTQTSFIDIEKSILACEVEGVETWLVADFVKTAIARPSIADFHGKPVLVFRTTPELTWQLLAKRAMDFIGAGVGLLVLGPLVMLPAAIAIKLTSPGPILFRQRRSGLHGRQFTMYKFRSMVSNAEMLRTELEAFNEATGPVFKIKQDPRVTPLGRWLRRTSIDEFPQLWNVLRGDMSLVGPRPPIPSEVEKYDPWHRRRLSMKPGLTCLWQISGRANIGFEQWMKLDLEYIDHWSLWLDLKILARTIPTVLGGLGAH
jgi:exopolysaccharide biosynthesis polyprenyl glycosylphosphotransferase